MWYSACDGAAVFTAGGVGEETELVGLFPGLCRTASGQTLFDIGLEVTAYDF